MFNTGDTVSYGTSGVCTIAEKKRLTLGGQPHECFILRPVFDASMKICVPCDSTPLLQKMRAMPTRDELLSLLREPAPTHDPDPEVRRETYREALKSGSLHELIAMVRDIYTERTVPRVSSFPPMRTAPCATPRTPCTASSPTSWASGPTRSPRSLKRN